MISATRNAADGENTIGGREKRSAAPMSPPLTFVAGAGSPPVPVYVCFPTKQFIPANIVSTDGEEFRGGIVSDDDNSCWDIADNVDGEDQNNSTTGIEAQEGEVRTSIAGEENMDVEVEDMMSLEPLDYRTPPRYESVIQNAKDWELMRPTLLKLLYTR